MRPTTFLGSLFNFTFLIFNCPTCLFLGTNFTPPQSCPCAAAAIGGQSIYGMLQAHVDFVHRVLVRIRRTQRNPSLNVAGFQVPIPGWL